MVEWELERQRRALAALLPGNGPAEEGRETWRRTEAGLWQAGTAGERIARKTERGASFSEEAGLPEGLLETEGTAVRLAGRDRVSRVRTPAGAWERILSAAEETAPPWRTAGSLSGFGKMTGEERGGFPGAGEAVRERTWGTPEDGGVWPGRIPGERARQGARAFENWSSDVRGRGGEGPSAGMPEREETAGRGADFSSPEGAGRRIRTDADEAETGRAVFRELAETVEPAGWGGGLEDGGRQAEDGARAVSLAVQRDARRYDGGFIIY